MTAAVFRGKPRRQVRAEATVLLACAAFSAAACAPRVAPPPPPPLSVDRPGAAIPGDLDVAIRVDLEGARRLLGPEFGSALALDITDADDRETSALVSAALHHADTAWIAFRPGLPPQATDNVLILRGDFGDIEPHVAGSDWATPLDLGGAMRVYRRHAPKRRSAPASIYARGDDWFVFVSTAEVDAAERTIERRSVDEHVDPPDHGVLSVAARARPLVQLLSPSYPAVAEALADARTVEGSAAADDRGLSIDLSARFSNGPDAQRARDRTRLLQSVLSHAEGPFGLLARGATVTALGTDVVVRIRLDSRAFTSVLSYLQPRGA